MINYQAILNKNLLKVFIEILKEIEKNGLRNNNHLYITFSTNNSKNLIPNWLLKNYPTEMTIVIQHEYYNLHVDKNFFNIGLSFNGKKTNLKIAFESIKSFADPSANFGLNFQFNNTKKNKDKIKREKNTKKNLPSNVINFSGFKKN